MPKDVILFSDPEKKFLIAWLKLTLLHIEEILPDKRYFNNGLASADMRSVCANELQKIITFLEA